MNYKNKKIGVDKRGFTLTEVMIGIMVLTVAIVSATNLLVGLIRSNKSAVDHLKAYYFAQEGVEAVRNIRDGNWMNNKEWDFDEGTYVVFLQEDGWRGSIETNSVESAVPWKFEKIYDMEADYNRGRICFYDEPDREYYSDCGAVSKETDFHRFIKISPYCEDETDFCQKDSVLVEAIVRFGDFDSGDEVTLSTVLTNWKGGAL